jgi:hypothetical protein
MKAASALLHCSKKGLRSDDDLVKTDITEPKILT